MTTAPALRLDDYWPDGTPPCVICGGAQGSGYGGWAAIGSSVREHRADLVTSGGQDLPLPGASDGGTGWLPVCSDFCARFGWETGGGSVLLRPAPIVGTIEAIKESWDGPCAVCGADCDDSEQDWGCWSSHSMSVKEYRLTRTREDDRLRNDAADDTWARLCSDTCERVAFPEDFMGGPDRRDVGANPSSPSPLSAGPALTADHANRGGATARFRRAARAGVATVARWCQARLVGTGHE